MSRYIRKELKFKHEGEEYVVVIQFMPTKLKQARDKAKYNNGAVLNSAKVFAMSAWRRIFK
jgi:hypothetical protein